MRQRRPGLALEVMPTGVASWRYRYQSKGKTEKVSLGQYPMPSLKEARTKRDELATLAFRGESPARRNVDTIHHTRPTSDASALAG